jgi:hypothetical protein
MADETNVKIAARDRSLPTPRSQGEMSTVRGTRYEEVQVVPHSQKVYAGIDDASYFIFTNPTLGTGIAGIAASTSYDAAEHLLLLRNTSTTKRVYLDFIDLVVTAAGAAGTTTGFSMVMDTGAIRYTSGSSSESFAAWNPNMDAAESAELTIKFGALVTPAATADKRNLGDFLVRTVIKVVGDSYRFSFGDSGGAWQLAGASLDGTTSAKVTIPCPGVVLGETDQFLLSDWAASQSGASSYQIRMGFWMR